MSFAICLQYSSNIFFYTQKIMIPYFNVSVSHITPRDKDKYIFLLKYNKGVRNRVLISILLPKRRAF
jgi:hypothetical protein